MSRYIDADALGIGTARPEAFERPEYAVGWNSAIEIIQNAPTADVAEVVRCKDCKHYHQFTGFCEKNSYFYDDDGLSCSPADSPNWTIFSDEDFCSRGERKNGDD